MKKFIIGLLSMILLSACSSNSYSSNASSSSNYSSANAEYAAADTTAVNPEAADSDQKLVSTGSITVEVKDPDTAEQNLKELISTYQGSISQMNSNGDGINTSSSTYYSRYISYTVKVPADDFDAFMNDCRNLGNATYVNTSVEDITESYLDNQAHLDSLKAEKQKLEELLQQAENIDDLLAIQTQLSDVEYQIESYQSIQDHYDNQVSYSSVSITLQQVSNYTYNEPNFLQRIQEGFSDSIHAFVTFLQNILLFVIFLLPYAAAIIILILIIRFIKKKKANARAKKAVKNI